jgi:hypothetical protein
VSPTTVALTPQAETDVLYKDVSGTHTRSFLPWTCFPKGSVGHCFGEAEDKTLLVSGSQEETESF